MTTCKLASGSLQCSNSGPSHMLCDDLENAVGCGEGSKRKGYTHPRG